MSKWDNVTALDVRTGQVVWGNRAGAFASNSVVVGDDLYALDGSARLVQLDVQTGWEKGYVQFTPAQTNTSEKRYWVAALGTMFFVSFGDSQELIALGP